MTQQYKQLGNSVTIPVIEEMALFIKKCMVNMEDSFDDIEKQLYSMYGDEFVMCKRIIDNLSEHLYKKTLTKLFDIVCHFNNSESFSNLEVSEFLHCTTLRSSQLLRQLIDVKCIKKVYNRRYKVIKQQK